MALSFPPLASNNYNCWSIQMKTFLRGEEVWDAIEVGLDVMLATAVTVKAQREARVRDPKALSFLHQGIDEVNFWKIAEAMTAKTAWDLLQKAYQSADERRKEEEKKKRIDKEREEKEKKLLFNSYRVAAAREDEEEDEIENDGETKKVDELTGDGNSGDPEKGLDRELKVREKECSERDDDKVREDNEQHLDERMDSEGKVLEKERSEVDDHDDDEEVPVKENNGGLDPLTEDTVNEIEVPIDVDVAKVVPLQFSDKGKAKVDVAESVNDEHVDEEVEKSTIEEKPLEEEPDEEESEEDPGEEEAFVEPGDEEFQDDDDQGHEEVEAVVEIETNVVAEKPMEDADEDLDDFR